MRALTFLAPGIPLELFQLDTEHLARNLGREVQLESIEAVLCGAIDDAAYAEERRALCPLGQIPAPFPGNHLS